MSDVREVLSALIDREPVDADLLARLLEDPSNRALLVDFVRVRADVLADGPEETGDLARGSWLPAHGLPRRNAPEGQGPEGGLAAPGSRLAAPGSRLSQGSRLTASDSRRWMRVAAIFLLLAAGAGGGAWLERYRSRERPPEPDRIVRLQPIDVQ